MSMSMCALVPFAFLLSRVLRTWHLSTTLTSKGMSDTDVSGRVCDRCQKGIASLMPAAKQRSFSSPMTRSLGFRSSTRCHPNMRGNLSCSAAHAETRLELGCTRSSKSLCGQWKCAHSCQHLLFRYPRQAWVRLQELGCSAKLSE